MSQPPPTDPPPMDDATRHLPPTPPHHGQGESPHTGYPNTTHSPDGYPTAAYPRQSHPQTESYPQTASFPQYDPGAEYPAPEYPAPGYPAPGYPAPQHPAPGYGAAGYPAPPPGPGYPGGPPAPPEPPAPRRSNLPLTVVIVACVLLLCGGVATAGVLVVRNVTDRAKKAVDGLPSVPTALPDLPKDAPKLPTELPKLPTELPKLPTDLPNLPGLPTGGPVKVSYRVDGDGPISITYLVKAGDAPKTLRDVKLPWRLDLTMDSLSPATVVALRTGASDGEVNCKIIANGKQVAESSRSGLFTAATCTKLVRGD